MGKSEVRQKEQEKLTEIFKNVEPEKQQLVEGLIQNAAFLFAENSELESIMAETGMVRVHPKDKTLQKITPAAAQYLKNVNSYATVVKALGSVLNKADLGDDDGLDDYE